MSNNTSEIIAANPAMKHKKIKVAAALAFVLGAAEVLSYYGLEFRERVKTKSIIPAVQNAVANNDCFLSSVNNVHYNSVSDLFRLNKISGTASVVVGSAHVEYDHPVANEVDYNVHVSDDATKSSYDINTILIISKECFNEVSNNRSRQSTWNGSTVAFITPKPN